ncbi:uncharacterized protein [Linepithema humile]|uniref:uncharacterized protein n=1 Tax=Linepithema humile TaxID=83485 RepID=UPI0006231352|nr:PREDICTED: uncharacterized protein LOC105677683 [Linepithema humile]
MERLSILFFNLCFFAVLVGSIYADSSATTETSKNGAYDIGDVKIHHADLLKSVENDSESSSMNENHVKDAAELGQHPAKGSSYPNKALDAFTTSVHSPSSSIDDMRHLGRIGNQEGDASRSDRKEESAVDLSHNILLDPSLIPARPARQAKKSDVDYTTASIEDIPGDAESHNNVESRSIDSSLRSSDLEGDLSVAEDRYQSPYQAQYPYWYRGQFPNQRYRTNDRREPYRNYLRYPVFPGK